MKTFGNPKSKLRPCKICYSGLEPEQIYNSQLSRGRLAHRTPSTPRRFHSRVGLVVRHAVGAFAGHAIWLSGLRLSTRVRLSLQPDIEILKRAGCFALFRTVSDPRCANLHRASQGASSASLRLYLLKLGRRISLNPCQPPSDSINRQKSTSKPF